MVGCSAVGCTNRSEQGYVMKVFPRDPERRKQWVAKVRRKNWTPTNSTFLCETHFESDMWEKTRVDGKRKLRHNAVPTLFSFVKRKIKPPPATAPNDDLNENLSNFIAKLEVESVNISPEHKPEIAVEIHELPTVPKIHSYAENGTWNHWAVTRNKKNSPLRKKRMQKPYSTESINKKYTDLVDERNELVKLQVAVARRELDILNNEEAHKEEMRKLERQRLLKRIEFDAEEHKLRVDLLKKQTSI
ncbi:THAP domain-containing protein 1-like isoform X4 [Photinus pyralis]|uniref:THAP domain-containing protein 1-like isoform X4 n=1 Tax=Photinus pyralis TaxID=7054 RepID=UPI0012677F35|nr:THAP domain-containing protein 1-like isoform X4 [Photinus pyralis]XP_031330759.1 THAP domain-containing protein 1-like isoform X4 [Photinus pyralis]XP_031330760.1 THAP domain-containing protein 1-like isoform X4 [Photinus pyralis]XP_031330761.1 THAP domain-containing protein 1-like isoform X4 [Photinus pyralis]